jgi:hypothetical protein
MLLRLLLAAVLSAAAMFLWGFVYWAPQALDMSRELMERLPDDAERNVVPWLRGAATPDGMYLFPGPMPPAIDAEATEVWEKRSAEGPLFLMAFHRAGMSPMDPAMMAKGLLHSFVVALLAGLLLAMVARAVPNYASRVAVVMLAVSLAAVWSNVGNVIWWFHTPKYCLGQMAYMLVGGLLIALITAALVRPTNPPIAASR